MRRHPFQLLVLFSLLSVFACDRVTPVAPVGSTITISVNPSRIDAQGEAATVTIIVRKEDGTPVNPGTQVNVSTTLGTLDPEVTFTDETGVATSKLIGDGRIGMATVSATTGAAALVSVDVQIGSVAASITLTVTPSEISRNPPAEGVTLDLLALVRDDTGAPLGGSVVNFRPDIGTLGSRGGPVTTDDQGRAIDTLQITPSNLSVLTEPFFTVSAETATEGGSLTDDLFNVLISGVPADLTLQATPSTVTEEGGTVTLLALVVDGAGIQLEGVRVTFLTNLGSLSSGFATTDSEGSAEVLLTLTAADISSLGATRTFDVTAQAAGLAGTVEEDTFQIRVTVCRPVVRFSCTQTAGNLLEFTFAYSEQVLPTYRFSWTFTDVNTQIVHEDIDFNDGSSSEIFEFPTMGSKEVLLQVQDAAPGCELIGSAVRVVKSGETDGCN